MWLICSIYFSKCCIINIDMAQVKTNNRKRVKYKGQPAWEYENGTILNANTGRIMRGGVTSTSGKNPMPSGGGIPIEQRKPEIKERIRHALSIDCNIQQTCIYAGIDYVTLRRIFERDIEFAKECAILKQTVPMAARETVALGVKVDPKVALSYLKLKYNREFSERVETDRGMNQPIQSIKRNVIAAPALDISDETDDE